MTLLPKPLSVLALLFFSATLPAFACDVCAIYAATDAQGGFERGFYFAAAEQFTHFGTLQDDGHEVGNPTGQHLDSFITQAVVGFGFTDRFSLQANVPIIHRSFRRPEGFATNAGRVSGIGDASVLGKFLLVRRDKEDLSFNWNLLAGVKLPTGSASRLREETEEIEVEGAPESGIHGHDLALGSGSFDVITGMNVYLRYKRAFISAAAQYAIRTEGDFDYRYANDLTWEGGPGYYLALNEAYTVAVQANFSGETKGRDTFRGETAVDTGLTAVYLGPKLIATWKERISADVSVDLPLSINNTALQAVPDYRIQAAITWRF